MVDYASLAGRSAARNVVQAAVLFGVMGIAGAAIVGDSIHAGCFDHDGPLRGVLGILTPAGMAVAGGVIGALAGRGRGSRYWVLSALVMLATGGTVGALVGPLSWLSPARIVTGAQDGMVFGAVALVVAAPVLYLTRRLERVRAGSVAAQSRQLVAWCAAGLSIAIGAALAVAASHPVPQCARGADATTLPVVAVVGALVALVSACASARIGARRRSLCISTLGQGATTGPLVAGPASVDLGIGVELWSAPDDAGPYRHAPARQADVIGDPLATLRSLHHDEAQAIVYAVGALAVAVLSLASTQAHTPFTTAPEEPSSPIASGTVPARSRTAGSFPADEEVVSRAFDLDARRCFPTWRNVDPGWGGRLAIALRVAPSGYVEGVTVPSRRSLSPDEARCLASVGRQARFAPRPMTDTLEVILPFYFP